MTITATLVNVLELAFFAYLLVGILFGIRFVATDVAKLDAAAQGAGRGFQLLILPGVAALWPWFALGRIKPADVAQSDVAMNRLRGAQALLAISVLAVAAVSGAIALHSRPLLHYTEPPPSLGAQPGR